MTLPLACTVRGCGQLLLREGRRYACARGHAYDVSRSGYVNLLQPQDRKSAEPGDARAAVEARARLEADGVGGALLEAVGGYLGKFALPPDAVMVDLGCGTGAALAAMAQGREASAIGIDVSVAAITWAARHWPRLTWVVANADRTLPLLDRSVDVLLSLHARRNPAEAARVLKPDGVLLVAVPAPDDLIELRRRVQGSGATRDRVPTLVAEHQAHFTLAERFRVADIRHLGREAQTALLAATYRGARRSEAPRVEGLTGTAVTLASDVCVFRQR